MEIKKNGKKMKIVGYGCLVFAALISIIALFTVKIAVTESLPVVYYWGGIGVTLLFGNAAKRIVGGAQINKANGTAK